MIDYNEEERKDRRRKERGIKERKDCDRILQIKSENEGKTFLM